MPELPEVETIVRGLAPAIVGRRILSAEILQRRVTRHSDLDLSSVLPGQKILRLTRHGKFLLFELRDGWLSAHLGMTGQLLLGSEPGLHTRAIFQLEGESLCYDDIRMFGSLESGRARVDALGPDALSVSDWHRQLRQRKTSVKSALLNQRVVAGLGNIYTDEALFRANIHPGAAANRLSESRAASLASTVRTLLEEAIEFRGSSISNYVDSEGRQGSFQQRHRVYDREGQDCVVCGSLVRRIVVAQRGTHFCPRCQKR